MCTEQSFVASSNSNQSGLVQEMCVPLFMLLFCNYKGNYKGWIQSEVLNPILGVQKVLPDSNSIQKYSPCGTGWVLEQGGIAVWTKGGMFLDGAFFLCVLRYFAKYLNILCHLSLDTLPFMSTYFWGGFYGLSFPDFTRHFFSSLAETLDSVVKAIRKH